MRRTVLFLSLLLCALRPLGLPAAERRSNEDLLQEATASFHAANQAALHDSRQAEQLYRKALLRYEQIVREGGCRTALVLQHRQILLRLGDTAGVLNYLAERFMPDHNLAQSLRLRGATRRL